MEESGPKGFVVSNGFVVFLTGLDALGVALGSSKGLEGADTTPIFELERESMTTDTGSSESKGFNVAGELTGGLLDDLGTEVTDCFGAVFVSDDIVTAAGLGIRSGRRTKGIISERED